MNETIEDLRAAWDAQADAWNQWDELGTDEIVDWAQTRAMARADARLKRVLLAASALVCSPDWAGRTGAADLELERVLRAEGFVRDLQPQGDAQ